MLTYLIPGFVGSTFGSNPDTVASVGGQDISVTEVQQELDMATRGQAVPDVLKGIYSRQVLDQIIFQRALELEADRLGIRVTPEEVSERIKQILPTAWSGDTWLKDRYATEVQLRTGMSVTQFETVLRDSMLQEKFRELVTAGITVSPEEIQQEFRRRNEKVQIEYAQIKPAELASTIHPSDPDLEAYYKKNAGRYQIPEKRSAHYALLSVEALRERAQIPDSAVSAFYNAHLDEYKVENRVHVQHILFKTIGKTDAEVAEIRAKASDVLSKAKHGGNFEELAKKYSEDDSTKPKGGDLGWIVKGQTVPEFEKVAFSEPKGSISDLVKSEFGFHIIKVIDREEAHTKSLDEVRSQILPILLDEKVNDETRDLANQLAAAVRQSNRQPLDDLAKKFNLAVGETPLASITEPVGNLGTSADLHQALFQLRQGELSRPIQTEGGLVILTPKEIVTAHQGTFSEVRDRALPDYQQEQSLVLAKQKADELQKLTHDGQALDKAAKSLDLTTKTPDAFPRTGSINEVGSAKQFEAAFTMPVGQVSAPVQIAGNWVIYRVVSHETANPDDLAKQTADIQTQLLQSKQSAAFDAFRTALEDRLKKQGKIVVNDEVMKRITKSA
jgi:peptidyl-prolyl cis-trans isomerase D